jgi:hypothetical protein
MASKDEIYRALTSAHERSVYFFIAASGAAIAYALARTEGERPAWWMAPVGVAIVMWGASFFCGTRYAQNRALVMNLDFELALYAENPPPNITVEKAEADVNALLKAGSSFGRWQLRWMFAGCVAYVVGHVWRLFAR